MTAATIVQPAPAETPEKTLAERRVELLGKAEFLAKPGGPVVLAGETATAQEARKAAVWFVLMKISNLVRVGDADDAQWRDGSPPAWAFPLSLTYPHKGDVGRVGELLIDATTGKVLDDSERVARIEADVRELARRTLG